MKFFALIIQIFLTSIVFSQKIDSDIELKHSVKQEGESYQFMVLSNDKKGVSKHDKTKYYFWYKSQKVIITQGGSSGQLLNGKFEAYYDNKQLSKKGSFEKGLKDGEWFYWRQDGSLIHTEHWKKGIKFGLETFYDEKGKVIETIDYNKRTFTKKTVDSLIVSNTEGSKKTITLLDKEGKITEVKKYKNGVELEVAEKKSWNPFKKHKSSSTEEKDKETKPATETEKKKGFKLLKKKKKQ